MCVAAVARIYTPGCKFDNVVTLIGSQGLGKSTFVSKLGGKWYSDSFGTIQGKEAYEAIQGVWIVEMAEMAGMKKAEKEQTKHFISKKEDRYRVAYGRRTENFPRQCIFIATTNEDDPLDDPTGNRRYWVISCVIKAALKSIFDDLPKEVDQIWAEAVELFKEGEPLYLSEGLYKEAQTVQKAHAIKDERARVVYKLLEMPVPPEWESMEHVDRLDYINGGVYSGNPIKKVTPEYIWKYAFRKDITELGRSASRDIKYIMSQIEGWEANSVMSFLKAYFKMYSGVTFFIGFPE
jgi:predicted P-loop ATPase